ncbi:MAG: hypothetical protein L3J79_03495 [Candidatus Marinimicrobia bacterium]|nr:hypothetical protein [Candidatus Neomarinimicrobiota bacterium]
MENNIAARPKGRKMTVIFVSFMPIGKNRKTESINVNLSETFFARYNATSINIIESSTIDKLFEMFNVPVIRSPERKSLNWTNFCQKETGTWISPNGIKTKNCFFKS